MHRLHVQLAGAAAVVLVLAACTASPAHPEPSGSPVPSTSPLPTSTATASTPEPAPAPQSSTPTPSPTPSPGEPCDPADGSPDCTDATGMEGGGFRYVEGYADCVATFGAEEGDGLCFDLDGDGVAGYPDSG